jgi:putative hydrolases of HD superfamily
MKKAEKETKLFFEAGQLKRVQRSGWWLAGIQNPESVAEHSWRAAFMGFFLGRKKGLDAEKVAIMLLLHDFPEARINDLHKVAQRYIELEKAERKAIHEQAAGMGVLGKEYIQLQEEFLDGRTPEARLAKQIDYLECAFQAKEYFEQENKDTKNWIENIGKKLKDKDCRIIFDEMKKTGSKSWWKGLKKI